MIGYYMMCSEGHIAESGGTDKMVCPNCSNTMTEIGWFESK